MIKLVTKKNIVIFVIVVGLVLIFWSSTLLQDYFQEAAVFLQNYGGLHPYLSILIFIGLSALSAMLVSFSSIWLVPVAVVLWSNLTTALLLLASWLIGAIVSYLIGRYGGYPVVKKFVSTERISYYEHLIAKRLGFWIIFLFRLTLPSEIPSYILGILRYPFAKYFLITFLAELPYAIYTVYAIDSIIDRKPTIFAITVIIWLIFSRKLVRQTQSQG
ncbi:hypothetical protein A2926_01295 [Candidatus Giovannonibacteria bacterium RIFCSPLOWO2_01_FULL_44_40]|uniref:VTT domain-containing protein n=1 Tax=Candidatus Giovannonibacteria bacterium RIFCSPHIGHO2_01_FULL_45_23 TaxID=1798325 RepID=A0A1F5VJF8_9BACT|nr:MAG: hypothetical protein A2834_02365 [Candidatus Giovannonibacteria bacterium RIFCSPHIGHO2_01_FULL_45_23]OGF75286.1 MAG: hypothetical protein A3C77_02420 [Candidatus Giovannonibacteria bacterium RIFCSPHIGHO2_02_FULL_45_13]OGF80046.1 MAG: hypothetical protein A2926_01295 [Candidatus Giovannonibacteria bacterium RIFCSPLOWO2_01_FULL_44_40]